MPPVEISVSVAPVAQRMARPSRKSIGPGCTSARPPCPGGGSTARRARRRRASPPAPRRDRPAPTTIMSGMHAHDAELLDGVVRGAHGAVGEAAADRDDLDVGLVVADVVAHLLEAAQGGEVGDRVGEDDLARSAPCRRRAGHVLLGDAGVDELRRAARSMNCSTTREAEVAGDERRCARRSAPARRACRGRRSS